MMQHPWKLVGPWYRQSSAGGQGSNRDTAPIIQKYADSNFSKQITQEPQRSLRLNSEDFVTRIKLDPNQVISEFERAGHSSPLKLFLDMHSRFYVVVCELHCDVPGFPMTQRNQTCEAGFVVRRRVPVISEQKRAQVAMLLKQRSEYQHALVKSQAQVEKDTLLQQRAANQSTIVNQVKSKSSQVFSRLSQAKVETHQQQLTQVNQQLHQLTVSGDIRMQLQGWLPTDIKGVGDWQEIVETPSDVTEQYLPMYPLIADPTNPNHSATGNTLWFGVIPTSSGDTDSQGAPKFDDSDLYEVRCFVRRHKPECPRKTNQRDCCGEIVWSKATEGYQLATPYDLDGTSHRPLNLKMPDLPALKAQAELGPAGRGAAAKMIAPEQSSLNFATDEMNMPEAGDPVTRPGQQICFFAIFLFFIVALFLFRLFLPILLFIFNLWFLLKLKFCIPPSIEFDAGLVVDLQFDGNFGIEFDASVQADIELMTDFSADLAVQVAANGPDIEAKFDQPGFSFTVNAGKPNEKTYSDKQTLQKDMGLLISNGINASDDMLKKMRDGDGANAGMTDALSIDELASIFVAMQTEYTDVKHPELAGELPSPQQGLVYFDIIKRNKVAA